MHLLKVGPPIVNYNFLIALYFLGENFQADFTPEIAQFQKSGNKRIKLFQQHYTEKFVYSIPTFARNEDKPTSCSAP